MIRVFDFLFFLLQVEILTWISSKHNMGMSLNREVWMTIKACAEVSTNLMSMPVYCWPSVKYSDPTINRHRVNSTYQLVSYIKSYCSHFKHSCWATVYDVGPTLNQHLLNVPCLLGWHFNHCIIRFQTISNQTKCHVYFVSPGVLSF